MLAPLPAAMVLCAGYGTRLRPLTDELPKPLVPVGDRSVLGHIASALKLAGFERLVVNAHHLPEVLRGALEGLPLVATPAKRSARSGAISRARSIELKASSVRC